jgi:hypothetical protein
MAHFSNAELAQKLSDLVDFWSSFNEEYANWLGGTVAGGPSSDGKYPLTDYTGQESLVDCPAKLSDTVGGYADDADASAIAAAASAAAALTSENNADTSEANALSHANDADSDRIAAAASATTSSGAATTATTQANLATDRVGYAAEWANKAFESLVSAAAGGDEVDDYSALHWATVAEGFAGSVDSGLYGQLAQAETVPGIWDFTNGMGLGGFDVDANNLDANNAAGPRMHNGSQSAANVPFAPNKTDPNSGLMSRGSDEIGIVTGQVWAVSYDESSFGVTEYHSMSYGSTASVTQTQGSGAQTSSYVNVKTCANENDTITLARNQRGAGTVMFVINSGAETLQVFPYSGEEIVGAGGINLPDYIPAGESRHYISTEITPHKMWTAMRPVQAALWDTAYGWGDHSTQNYAVKTAAETITADWIFSNAAAKLTISDTSGAGTGNLVITVPNTAQAWIHMGGTTDPDAGRIGYSDNAEEMYFYTDNVERLELDSAEATFAVPVTAPSYGGITEANLLDKSVDESITGAYTFANSVTSALDPSLMLSHSGFPSLVWYETGGAVDNKLWDITVYQEAFLGRLATDAGSSDTEWLRVERTGTTVDSIALKATTTSMTGALQTGELEVNAALQTGAYKMMIAGSLATGKLTTVTGDKLASLYTYYDDAPIEISAGTSATYKAGIVVNPRSTTSPLGEGVSFMVRDVEQMQVKNGNILEGTALNLNTTAGHIYLSPVGGHIYHNPASGYYNMFIGGRQTRFYDTAGSNYTTMYQSSTNTFAQSAGTGTTFFNYTVANMQLLSGTKLNILDAANTDYVQQWHDGGNYIMKGTNTNGIWLQDMKLIMGTPTGSYGRDTLESKAFGYSAVTIWQPQQRLRRCSSVSIPLTSPMVHCGRAMDTSIGSVVSQLSTPPTVLVQVRKRGWNLMPRTSPSPARLRPRMTYQSVTLLLVSHLMQATERSIGVPLRQPVGYRGIRTKL